mmetsp:Transcript_5788/g.12660  ORF Transcript_5788/g.12660 Transcript_5788/m.12660 type:complete len:231 (+) Transcript_5788:921-1613(+)
MDFLGSSSFGVGTPKTALASRFSSDSGTEGDPDGRLDVPPFVSPRIFLRAMPMLLSRPLSFLFTTPSFSSSYKTMPGSALIASCAAVVSGCQLAWRWTIFHLPPIFRKIFVVSSLFNSTPPRRPMLVPADPLAYTSSSHTNDAVDPRTDNPRMLVGVMYTPAVAAEVPSLLLPRLLAPTPFMPFSNRVWKLPTTALLPTKASREGCMHTTLGLLHHTSLMPSASCMLNAS